MVLPNPIQFSGSPRTRPSRSGGNRGTRGDWRGHDTRRSPDRRDPLRAQANHPMQARGASGRVAVRFTPPRTHQYTQRAHPRSPPRTPQLTPNRGANQHRHDNAPTQRTAQEIADESRRVADEAARYAGDMGRRAQEDQARQQELLIRNQRALSDEPPRRAISAEAGRDPAGPSAGRAPAPLLPPKLYVSYVWKDCATPEESKLAHTSRELRPVLNALNLSDNLSLKEVAEARIEGKLIKIQICTPQGHELKQIELAGPLVTNDYLLSWQAQSPNLKGETLDDVHARTALIAELRKEGYEPQPPQGKRLRFMTMLECPMQWLLHR
jgi:hypothetical protein